MPSFVLLKQNTTVRSPKQLGLLYGNELETFVTVFVLEAALDSDLLFYVYSQGHVLYKYTRSLSYYTSCVGDASDHIGIYMVLHTNLVLWNHYQ